MIAFQSSRELDPTGVCDPATWEALVEAGRTLGDRLLYLTSPMLRGDDVADLQLRLGALGFDAGKVDGIFGSMTELAIEGFQQQIGLVADRVVGPDTVAALGRLQPRGGTNTVAGVRERVALASRADAGEPLTISLVHRGDGDPLVGPLALDLVAAGRPVHVLIDDDWSRLAEGSNAYDSGVCLALTLDEESACDLTHFEVTGFTSFGGRRLAHLIAEELPPVPSGWSAAEIRGSRSPILRETRAPTVHLRIGPSSVALAHRSLIVAALHRALRRWEESPD